MGVSIGPNVVQNGLTIALDAINDKSYPGTGTDWADLSPPETGGTLNGKITYDSTNGSFDFDGTDDYVELDETFTMDSAGATLMWWMAPSSATTNYNLFGASSSGGVLQLIEYRYNVNVGAYFYAETNNNCGYFSSPTFTVWNNNEWHHVAVRFNNNQSHWFIDGQNIGETTDYGSVNCSATPLTNLGGYDTTLQYIGSGGYSNRYDGLINHIMLYDHALLDREIFKNYRVLKTRFA